jgi:hypothetical protein
MQPLLVDFRINLALFLGNKSKNKQTIMKKLFALIALVAFFGVVSQAQTTSTDNKQPEKQETKVCTEAEKAACEKECSKTGAKCVTTDAKAGADAKTEKSCSGSKSGSCCSKGTTSASGSCCQKGGATGSTQNATDGKKKEKSKSVAQVQEKK